MKLTPTKKLRDPSIGPSDFELMRFDDDGGAIFDDGASNEAETTAPKKSREPKVEFTVLIALVIGAHVSPFAATVGVSSMQHHACETIAVVFCYLSISLLTVRVVFQERRRIQSAIDAGSPVSVLSVLGVGAATAAVWAVPTLAGVHMAEVVASAMVVLVAQLVSMAVDQRLRANWMMHDIIPMIVLLFAMSWVYSNPHFVANHGQEFLAATTVGASSIHSWQAVLAAIGRLIRPIV